MAQVLEIAAPVEATAEERSTKSSSPGCQKLRSNIAAPRYPPGMELCSRKPEATFTSTPC